MEMGTALPQAFSTILTASHTLSRTIQLDELLHQLTQVILQHSGADRCALILPNSAGEWIVRAIATPEATELSSEPLANNPNLPTTLIEYVKTTQEVVVINDLNTDMPVADSYLNQHNPKSVLCLPMLNQGHLLGILYLKNRSMNGVFTDDRILILDVLCTQAAISLENARLYLQEQEKAREIAYKELQYRNIFESVSEGIAISDLETGLVVTANPALCEMYGYSEAEWQNLRASDLLHPDSLHLFSHFLDTLKKSQKFNAQGVSRRKDNTFFEFEVKAVPCLYNSKIHGLTIITDVSDRNRTEACLQASESRNRAILKALPDMMFCYNSDGIYIDFIPSTDCDPLISPDSFLGKSVFEVLPPGLAEQIFAALSQAISTNQIQVLEYRLEVKGKWHDYETRLIAYEGNRVLQIVRDISDRKQAEAAVLQKSQELEQALNDLKQTQLQMIQSEKMSALGNLIAGVAHEINNPVGFISGNLNEAKLSLKDIVEHLELYRSGASPSEIADHAEEIDIDFMLADLPKMIDSMQVGCDRIKGISTSLRTFSRADQDHKVACNLQDGIDSTILILKHRLKANELRPGIQVVTDYGNLPPIDCFSGQLNQVFTNILANAIDVFDEMAENQCFIDFKDNPQQIMICTEMIANQVQIRILDNGKGMTSAVQEKIFDHLFTTKAVGKGTGLGLAIAHQIIVENHGGAIEVHSTVGQGTEFIIQLPLA
jgi:PAS domain S-box-containing protein